jgi:CrcB protein
MLLLFIGLGGAVGALARHGLITWVDSWAGTTFPWGTLTVNVTGSFLIGLLMGYVEVTPMSPALRTLLAVGLLGSFTTFSTYALETVALVRDGFAMRAALYSFGSLALGAVAVCAGLFGVVQSVRPG